MLNIKNTISFAALVCGLLIVFAMPQKASAQFIPPGSYQKTCKNIKTYGADLSADCKHKDEEGSVFGGKPFNSATEDLKDYFECDGGIINDDGQFKCTRNLNSALMQKAKEGIDQALKSVYGIPDAYKPSYPIYKNYLQEMFKAGYAPSFYAGTLGTFLSEKNARVYFLDKFNSPDSAKNKAKIIDLTFKEIYGTGVSPNDLAGYMAKRTGYNEIITNENKKLNADKILRRLAISYAYKKAMGRPQTPAETDYWMARTEYYEQIVSANRAFLYGGSVKGNSDLTETVKRYLLDKGIDKPSIERINAEIVRFSQSKAIYDEMK